MPSTFDTVLVASSLTRVGTPGVCRALALAKAAGARAVLIHALHPTAADAGEGVELAPGSESVESATCEELEEQAASCPKRPDPVECRVIVGAAHRAIARVAEEIGADLVVAGAREQGSLTEKLLGSTADRLARRCSAPVLVSRDGPAPLPSRVLLPVDLSSSSKRSLERALKLLAALSLSRAIRGTLLFVLGPREQLLYPGDLGQTLRRLGLELEALAHRALPVGTAMSLETHVAEGDPCEVILEQARSEGSDWIVVGSHGRGGFERFLIGSVASDVARTSPISVLVVPPGAEPREDG